MARDARSGADPRAGGGDGDAVPEAQLDEVRRLQAERPCIEDAIKNFLSMKLAAGVTSGEAPSSGIASATDRGCARVLLRAVNGLELPASPEWGLRHPQREEENGTDFLARIGTYKVVRALWQQCLNSQHKPAKLLGRTACSVAFPEIEEDLFRDLPGTLSAAGGATEDQLRGFVSEFRSTLPPPAGPAMTADGSNAELVWAADVRAVLAARQAARKAEAADRVERAASAEDFAGQLRAAVGNDGPHVEEVMDEDGEEEDG